MQRCLFALAPPPPRDVLGALGGGLAGGSQLVSASCCASDPLQLGVARPLERVTRVPHVRQCYNWDCGLACVLMVLRTLGIRGHNLAALRDLCPTTSIWTIDLAHLLRRFGLGVLFTTLELGANPAYAGAAFYAPTLAEDHMRVERLFREAAAGGICIQQRALAAAELQDVLLAGSHLIIALVDKSKLGAAESGSPDGGARGVAGAGAEAGAEGSPDKVAGGGGCCWPAPSVAAPAVVPVNVHPAGEQGYTGHYVVVCGYSRKSDCFTLHDPAGPDADIAVPTAALDAARHAFGTDEDVLLVSTAHRHTSKRERFFQGITQFVV